MSTKSTSLTHDEIMNARVLYAWDDWEGGDDFVMGQVQIVLQRAGLVDSEGFQTGDGQSLLRRAMEARVL